MKFPIGYSYLITDKDINIQTAIELRIKSDILLFILSFLHWCYTDIVKPRLLQNLINVYIKPGSQTFPNLLPISHNKEILLLTMLLYFSYLITTSLIIDNALLYRAARILFRLPSKPKPPLRGDDKDNLMLAKFCFYLRLITIYCWACSTVFIGHLTFYLLYFMNRR